MKKLLVLAVVALSGIAAGSGFAAQPADPGCFGQDRADWIHANSGAAWGVIASQERKGDNSSINAEYKATVCK
jgi:hypothetical protein